MKRAIISNNSKIKCEVKKVKIQSVKKVAAVTKANLKVMLFQSSRFTVGVYCYKLNLVIL
jgi:hypothetical protein